MTYFRQYCFIRVNNVKTFRIWQILGNIVFIRVKNIKKTFRIRHIFRQHFLYE